jgi:hypothetical protein
MTPDQEEYLMTPHFQDQLQKLCWITADSAIPQRDEQVGITIIGFLERLAAAHGKQIHPPQLDEQGEILFHLVGRRSRYGAELAACLNLITVRTQITLVKGYIRPEDNACRIPMAEAQKLLVKLAWDEAVRPLAVQANHPDHPTYH